MVVMRHAKAEPYASTDLARRLTERGRQQAAAAGARLRELGLVPEHAVVSTAERTRMTWDEIAAATGASTRDSDEFLMATSLSRLQHELLQRNPREHEPVPRQPSHRRDHPLPVS